MIPAAAVLRNPQAVDEGDIPVLPPEEFRRDVISASESGARLAALFGRVAEAGAVKIYALLASDETGECAALAMKVRERCAALTPDCPQAHWFEREIAEQFAVRPEGHPWLKPLRFHRNYRGVPDVWAGGGAPAPIPGPYPYFRVAGEEVHEVAVGPVHAGIIEPGHFRFQCHGERVVHLEIQLGHQHRGMERLLEGGPSSRSMVLAESIAGDTVVGHALAHCEALEALAGCQVSPRAQALRGLALELERVANHIGDLGALGTDIAFQPAAAYFGRLRGEFLNSLMDLTGNRYGRSFLRPGGVLFDMDAALAQRLRERLGRARRDLQEIARLFFENSSVLDRLEGTGAISRRASDDLGLVGPAARACGSPRDVRRDHPHGIFRFAHIPIVVAHSGDVHARALVRWLEAERSLDFLEEQAGSLPEGELRVPCAAPAPGRCAVAMVEGWRGEIVHCIITDAGGRIARCKIVDPSFHNWMGLAMALRDGAISDFPLCNKSFNLSYAGHDL